MLPTMFRNFFRRDRRGERFSLPDHAHEGFRELATKVNSKAPDADHLAGVCNEEVSVLCIACHNDAVPIDPDKAPWPVMEEGQIQVHFFSWLDNPSTDQRWKALLTPQGSLVKFKRDWEHVLVDDRGCATVTSPSILAGNVQKPRVRFAGFEVAELHPDAETRATPVLLHMHDGVSKGTEDDLQLRTRRRPRDAQGNVGSPAADFAAAQVVAGDGGPSCVSLSSTPSPSEKIVGAIPTRVTHPKVVSMAHYDWLGFFATAVAGIPGAGAFVNPFLRAYDQQKRAEVNDRIESLARDTKTNTEDLLKTAFGIQQVTNEISVFLTAMGPLVEKARNVEPGERRPIADSADSIIRNFKLSEFPVPFIPENVIIDELIQLFRHNMQTFEGCMAAAVYTDIVNVRDNSASLVIGKFVTSLRGQPRELVLRVFQKLHEAKPASEVLMAVVNYLSNKHSR